MPPSEYEKIVGETFMSHTGHFAIQIMELFEPNADYKGWQFRTQMLDASEGAVTHKFPYEPQMEAASKVLRWTKEQAICGH